jgi:hypothetical protein
VLKLKVRRMIGSGPGASFEFKKHDVAGRPAWLKIRRSAPSPPSGLANFRIAAPAHLVIVGVGPACYQSPSQGQLGASNGL